MTLGIGVRRRDENIVAQAVLADDTKMLEDIGGLGVFSKSGKGLHEVLGSTRRGTQYLLSETGDKILASSHIDGKRDGKVENIPSLSTKSLPRVDPTIAENGIFNIVRIDFMHVPLVAWQNFSLPRSNQRERIISWARWALLSPWSSVARRAWKTWSTWRTSGTRWTLSTRRARRARRARGTRGTGVAIISIITVRARRALGSWITARAGRTSGALCIGREGRSRGGRNHNRTEAGRRRGEIGWMGRRIQRVGRGRSQSVLHRGGYVRWCKWWRWLRSGLGSRSRHCSWRRNWNSQGGGSIQFSKTKKGGVFSRVGGSENLMLLIIVLLGDSENITRVTRAKEANITKGVARIVVALCVYLHGVTKGSGVGDRMNLARRTST